MCNIYIAKAGAAKFLIGTMDKAVALYDLMKKSKKNSFRIPLSK